MSLPFFYKLINFREFWLTIYFKLAEYTHVEAELDFITFDDLLDQLEDIICRVIDLVLQDPSASESIKKYNPEFTNPARPLMRMRYSVAIDWLRARDIKTADGKDHVFGDDMLVSKWSRF